MIVAALQAISVPLNTRLTPAELRVILEDAEATVLVAASHYRGRNYVEEALDAKDPKAAAEALHAAEPKLARAAHCTATNDGVSVTGTSAAKKMLDCDDHRAASLPT